MIRELFEFESYTDYGQEIRNNDKRGIELNEANGNKCATQTGKVRAQQLADGEAISLETIKRMYSYLSRAETYYDENDTKACGTISYLLWGGKSALSWSRSKLKELGVQRNQMIVADSAEPKSIEDLRRAGFRIEGAKKGPDSIRNSIDTLQQYEMFITKDSLNAIKELRNYKWATDKDGNMLNVPIDSQNHFCDCIRYIALNRLKKSTFFIQ